MKIRNEHIDAFETPAVNAFIDRELAYFKKIYGDELSHSDEELRVLFRRWIDDAEKYGIEDQRQVERFLNQCLTQPSLMEEPKSWQLMNILTWPEDNEEQKMDNLEEYFERF